MKLTIQERFEKKFIKDIGCWIWRGAISSTGYGNFRMNGTTHVASRVSWLIYKGQIPPGLFVCHHCDNPVCVNPDHLFTGTNQDNFIDARDKGRLKRLASLIAVNVAKTHCPRGHEYTGDNLSIKKGTHKRQCRTCHRDRNRNAYWIKKEGAICRY